MTRREAWRLIGAAAINLLACGGAQAGKQAKAPALWLVSGDWHPRVVKGEVYLVECPWHRDRGPPKAADRDLWRINSPAIKTDEYYLAYSLKGKEPSVQLVKKSGDDTHWYFEKGQLISPKKDGGGKGAGLLDGYDGFTFRVRASNGDFSDWYLAAEDPPKERKDKAPMKRRLTLVRDKKKALVLEYLQTFYYRD